MNTLDVLLKARKMLDPPGRWVRKTWFTRKKVAGRRMDCYCLDGALRVAAGAKRANPNDAPDPYFDAAALVHTVLRQDYDWHQGLVSWNDYAAKDKRQVLRVLDKAIKRAKEA